MNTNLTDITIILDSSGSMQGLADDTIGGFNTFLKTQQEQPGHANISLVQFDSDVSVTYNARNIQDAPELNNVSYRPEGYTALLDAIGISITSAGTRLAAMKEEDRPSKVIFVIMTDGDENSSREYNSTQIHDMIKHQTETYQWDFIFIGANQDAIKTGGNLGIGAGNSLNYQANANATKALFGVVGDKMSSYRSATGSDKTAFASSMFNDSDRAATIVK